ncbi:MAG TPA: PDDEXK nuclease domain-containing protein [Pirellulales bacterium]|nr:PDDEXK nuclease domain-containing protein [Pirellulales bacterium]
MSKIATRLPADFPRLLNEIKDRIQHAQTRAVLAVNSELVHLYWDIGRIIDARQQREGWGAGVIPRLAHELANELPEEKGFSERNIKSMLAFYRAYPDPAQFVQQAAAQLPTPRKRLQVAARLEPAEKVQQSAAQLPASILWSIPWFHHVVLMTKVKDMSSRLWYMQQTLANGWSRNVLLLMIKSEAHTRQGRAVTNFERVLPAPRSDLVRQTLKDPYIFDFLTLEEPFHERELETNLLHQLERFLLELGQGFAFVGRQYYLQVGDREFYIDLLFYHLKLRCFIVIDLKKGEFKPEYAGVVDDKLRHGSDQPSLGLILCQDRNHIVAEYALRGADKPIGISEYELTRALPPSLKSALPTVEEIEAELAGSASAPSVEPPALPAPDRKAANRPKPSGKSQPARGRKKRKT